MCAMPLDLTAEELATAAQACRAMAYQEGKRAEAMENPSSWDNRRARDRIKGEGRASAIAGPSR
jgi:hypothetical protein